MDENKTVSKSASIIGSATFISRIFGFLRDIMIAAFFGTGMYAQAFIIAFKIPNILRSVVGEGTTNGVIVPILSEHITLKGKKEFWELATNLLFIVFFILILFTVIGVFIAPLIVRIIAPGFLQDLEKLHLTVKLTRIIFPYVFFIGLTSIFIGILNSLKYFTIPAFSQVAFNLLFIVWVIIFYFFFNMGVFSLAFAVIIGGVGQALLQIPSLFKFGFKWPKHIFYINPAMKKILHLFIPRLVGAGVYHINVLIDTILASLSFIVGKGAVAALYYSNRLVQFPLAIFGLALAQAALPTFSRQSLEKNLEKFKKTLNFSLRSIFFMTIPATLGLIVLRTPITRLFFERGEFDIYSTYITSYTLVFYVIGLCFYGGIKILVNSFYSLKDTVTPVKIASISVIVNLVLNLILMKPLKVGGLALATSLAAILNFFLLYIALSRKIGKIYEPQIGATFLKSLFASSVMAGICYVMYFNIYRNFIERSFFTEILSILIIILISGSIYLIICYFMNMSESKKILKLFKNRLFKNECSS